MVRTQIQVTEEQAERLRRLAAERDTSMAALIRDAVDALALGADPDERRRRALAVVGGFASGTSDTSAAHDRYLAESYTA